VPGTIDGPDVGFHMLCSGLEWVPGGPVPGRACPGSFARFRKSRNILKAGAARSSLPSDHKVNAVLLPGVESSYENNDSRCSRASNHDGSRPNSSIGRGVHAGYGHRHESDGS